MHLRFNTSEFKLPVFNPVRQFDVSFKGLIRKHPLVAVVSVLALLVFSLSAAINGYLVYATFAGCAALSIISKLQSAPRDFFKLIKHCLAVQYYSFKLWMLI